MLRYYKVRRGEKMNWREPISYEEALNIMLGSWKDNDMTRDMLILPNRIQCMYSEIGVEEVTEDGHVFCSMPGLYNLLPSDIEYDEDGNRVPRNAN